MKVTLLYAQTACLPRPSLLSASDRVTWLLLLLLLLLLLSLVVVVIAIAIAVAIAVAIAAVGGGCCWLLLLVVLVSCTFDSITVQVVKKHMH